MDTCTVAERGQGLGGRPNMFYKRRRAMTGNTLNRKGTWHGTGLRHSQAYWRQSSVFSK